MYLNCDINKACHWLNERQTTAYSNNESRDLYKTIVEITDKDSNLELKYDDSEVFQLSYQQNMSLIELELENSLLKWWEKRFVQKKQ